VLERGAVRTHDLGGTATTTEFTDAVCRAIERSDVARRRHLRPSPLLLLPFALIYSPVLLDDITQAVLAREEIARYLRGRARNRRSSTRASASTPISTSSGPRSATDLPRAEASALSHPAEDRARARARAASRRRRHEAGRVLYVSNHKSHLDYLVEPLVLDDNGMRPPVIAAGINLFGGPLGLLHRHVTGAVPIRRNTKDPAYLITLKAYVAELLRTPRPALLHRGRAGATRAS
jgi:hypothetical protein